MAYRLGMLAALAAGIVVVGVAIESSSARPDAAAVSKKFISKRYGYQIVLAGRWKPTYARTAWRGKFPLMDSGEVDFFEDSRERFFIVGATRLPSGTRLKKWAMSHAAVMSDSPYCEEARAFRSTKLGGVAAREFQSKCFVHDAIVVAAVHRGRGYTFQLASPRKNSTASDRRLFEMGRRGYRFTSR